MAYLKQTIVKFDERTIGKYKVSDFTSVDLSEINTFVDNNPDLFDWHQLQNNTNIEKVALDLYGDPDFWDILLVINNRQPLTELPYDFDVISNVVDQRIDDYIKEVYIEDLPVLTRETMYNQYLAKQEKLNDEWRVIKIVDPSKINDFMQKGYEEGYFK